MCVLLNNRDPDDPFSFPFNHGSYAKYEWVGLMELLK
jgi:hypothetical protein